LNDEEKEWMNQFMKEYNDADTKNAVFHTDAQTRKICNDKNNARNRCWYTEEAAANRLNLIESDYEMERLIYKSQETEEDLDGD
jgi:aminopeptidase C